MTNFSSLAAAAGLSGTQYRLRYEQSSCRLELTGLPDVTAAAEEGAPKQRLDILTNWALILGQRANLQGKREHLEALVQAVIPYVRLLVSAQPRPLSDSKSVVTLEPSGERHHLVLRSSQPNTPPLELLLDDAELADLNQCLDQMLVDTRMGLNLAVQPPQPLRRGEYRRHTLQRRGQWLPPAIAVGALAMSSLLISLVPLPQGSPIPQLQESSTESTTKSEEQAKP